MLAIGIVGWKNSGKTTLIARLIPRVRELGLSVSTIKHVHHDVDLDTPGKDTYVHREAGAVDVVMFSEARWAILHERRDERSRPVDLGDLMRRLSPVDLVIVEGFKHFSMPRIEVRSDPQAPPIRRPDDLDVFAVVTDGMVEPGVASFKRDEVDALAGFVCDFVESRSLRW